MSAHQPDEREQDQVAHLHCETVIHSYETEVATLRAGRDALRKEKANLQGQVWAIRTRADMAARQTNEALAQRDALAQGLRDVLMESRRLTSTDIYHPPLTDRQRLVGVIQTAEAALRAGEQPQ